MDIRDELDAMLNNLKNGTPKSAPKASTPPPAPRKSVYDKMSVDELVTALSDENKPKPSEPKPAPAPKKSAPQPPQNGIPQNLLDMLGDTADEPARPRFAAKKAAAKKTEPKAAPVPEKPKKKRIVISGELPNYEEIRQRSLQEDAEKAEREAREKAEREAKEKAEREAKEKAEREAREKAEREAKEKAEREAREKAEREAREKAEREAREQAEREAREKAEREAKEKAEREAIEKAEREAREQAEREAREKTEREAKEKEDAEADSESEYEADEESSVYEEETVNETEDTEEEEEEKPKKGFLSGLKSLFSKKDSDDDEDDDEDDDDEDEEDSDEEDGDDDEHDDESDSDEVSDEILPEADDEEEFEASEDDSQLSASELIDKALAAIEEENLTNDSEDESSDSVDSLIADIREDAANTIAEITEGDSSEAKEEEVPDTSEENDTPQPEIDIALDTPKKKGRVVSALERILDEDPAALSDERREKPEADEIDVAVSKKKSKDRFKRSLFAFLGVIFTLLAIVGLIASVNYGVSKFRSFSVGETKRDRFTEVIYPAVIMDIESFANPSELASDQVISAALWSFVMKGDFSKYTVTFDIISVPAVDVESFAAQLFGENLPELTHTTVGSGELKFYYNEAQKCYNVPIQPISFTYEPEITYVSKTGNEYTITVDYIRELPAWMKNKEDYTPDISKTVEFRITEKDDSYTINSMTVINVNRVD